MKNDRKQIGRILQIRPGFHVEESFVIQLEHGDVWGNRIDNYQTLCFESNTPIDLYLQHPESNRIFLAHLPRQRRVLVPMQFSYAIKNPNIELATLTYGFSPQTIPHSVQFQALPQSLDLSFEQLPKGMRGEFRIN